MGIDGAALATGLGQVLTLVIYLLFYYLRPISVKIRLQHLRPSRRTWWVACMPSVFRRY